MQKNKALQIRAVTETALAAALIAVSAMISIPFPVPFTLQIFGVYFALFYLGGRRGAIAVLLYIALGALGLPVFSGFSGGVGRLFDATGGFIWGFLLLAAVYMLLELILPRVGAAKAIASVAALALFYLFGSVWYAAIYVGGGFREYLASLLVTVAPFLLPDAVKIALAYGLSLRIMRALNKKSPEKSKSN